MRSNNSNTHNENSNHISNNDDSNSNNSNNNTSNDDDTSNSNSNNDSDTTDNSNHSNSNDNKGPPAPCTIPARTGATKRPQPQKSDLMNLIDLYCSEQAQWFACS